MDLSVIIVNFNVKHFLEQCLYSVQKAISGMDAEIIVVDNCSSDNSLVYLTPKFPAIQFIANKENEGFSKGCNKGLKVAKGKFILFLNPDTIVPENCFHQCISFFQSHPEAGAIGIKMLDGHGQFLKESKRAFPSPATSFYKLFGFSDLFPHSKIFSKYHLGYLDENTNHEVDVLAGAFFMTTIDVLAKVGSYDETFFMYGEDVDLSYRIQEAGYKNFYFAESNILHFKGESTRKGSMNYVRMFYNAMNIFVRKHYRGGRAGLFNIFIHLAIGIRALLSATGHFIRRMGLPLIDAGLIIISFIAIRKVWNVYIRPDTEYQSRLLWIAFPAYTILFLITSYYAGLYDRWYKRTELLRSMGIAIIVLLAAYSLLPEQYRFSRGIILFGALLAFSLISMLRWVLIKLNVLNSLKEREENASTIIIGTTQEYQQLSQLIKDAGYMEKIVGRVTVDENDKSGIGWYKKLRELTRLIPFRELIFCEGKLSFKEIIQEIQLMPRHISIKIHASGSSSVIGSDSKDTAGEFLSKENGFNIANPYNLRLKRLIDVTVAILGILFFPVHLFFIKKPFSFFINCFTVLLARNTWVGYVATENSLPPIRPGIIACNGALRSNMNQLSSESIGMVDYWYAHEYLPSTDLWLLWKMYRNLGG